MKILHLADLHFRATKFKDIVIAHNDSLQIAENENVDLIVIAGDIWDGSTANTAGAMFSKFVSMVNDYANIAPVAIIYGTPTHDVSGSLEIFESQLNTFGITLLQPGQPYFYNNTGPTIEKSPEVAGIKSSLLLLGVPEPSKKHIVSNIESKGKTATEAAVRQEMHSFFLGLTAIRKEHQRLPCILLYHGQVAGSKMQNDQIIDRGSGISITYDDLAVVGADYYALGDIHEPQQIGDLPAYYPGSFYNTSFGETHRPGCNIVEINYSQRDLFTEKDKKVDIRRKLFNLPQQVKEKVEYNNLIVDQLAFGDSYAGKRVWIEVRCTKEQAHSLDIKDLTVKLIKAGAEENSRITLDIIATETVRAAEITEQKNLRDKVIVWAEASGKEIDDRLLEKADELEESETSKNASSDACSIQIDKLILRGAIGIWKGLKVDEVTVDFSNILPGIVALIGGNGQGKTTLIENLHPWPQMLTRSSALKHHFRLKDSCRDLYFTDTKTGIKYRALLEIDGKNKTGSIDYYLFHDIGNGYEAIENISGRKEAYFAEIEKLFGSLTLYQKTAFITQKNTKNNPDLSSASKGVKKGIFAELSGLQYLKEYSEIAKKNAEVIEFEILKDSGKIEAYSGVDDEISSNENREIILSARLKEISISKVTLESEVSAIEKQVDHLRLEVEKNNSIKVQLDKLEKSRIESNRLITENEEIIKTSETAVKYKKDAIELKENVESLRLNRQEILTKKNEYDSRNNSVKENWLKECKKIDNQKQELNSQLNNLIEQKREVNQRLDKVNFEISILEKETEIKPDTTCPTCRQDLPEATKQEIYQIWESKVGELEVYKRALENIQSEELKPIEDEITKVQAEILLYNNPKEPELELFDETELNKVQSSLSFIESRYEDACSTIKTAEEAETKISICKDKIEDITSLLSLENKQIDQLNASYNSQATMYLQDTQADLKTSQDKLSEATREYIETETTLVELRKNLDNLRDKLQTLKFLEVEIEKKKIEAGEWRLLKDICGENGIQALELDALAPNIATIANHILKAAYGSKFQIEFRTVKASGSGSKAKQIEDFSIWVMDIENGTEQLLEDLSGGEEVWIKKAIYSAFAKIRSFNTGKTFLTVCQDEADGALDPEMKEKYFRMIEAAHNESHLRHTIIITHSREIQEMAQQKIVMSELIKIKSASIAA